MNYRLGNSRRPKREWEVFNNAFGNGRDTDLYDEKYDKPWVAYHPDQNTFTFATHAEAIKHINKVESGDIW